MSDRLTYAEQQELKRLVKKQSTGLSRLSERVENWKPRQEHEWAVKAPPMIDQATLEEAQTGRELTPEQYEKACQDRLTLEIQSCGIAARLKRCGINVYQDSVAILGLYSEEMTEKTQYKNTNFIPEVQAKNTHDMLKSVQYWLDITPSNQTRMWVFSWGWVPLHEYREAHQKFTRWISKFSKHDILKATQIDFSYYSIEGTIQKDKGITYVNLHAHVLLRAGRHLGEQNWSELCDQVKARAPKGYFNDSPIRKAAEVVKYCFKPSEFDLLNDDQLAAFYNACKGLRFYTPLSNLREFRGQLKESRLKLKHIETDKGPAWRLVKGRTRGRLEDIEEDKQEQIDGSASSTVNVICGITAPSPTFSEVYEPSVIIRNFDGNLEGLLALNPWIEQRIAAVKKTVARQQEHQRQIEYRRARDRRASPAPSIWDTTTITVQNPVGEMIDSWFAPPEIPDDMGEAAWA